VTISATNTTYDGQDIVVNSATVTINGTHRFNSLLAHEQRDADAFALHGHGDA
jgi:hypothetical protein